MADQIGGASRMPHPSIQIGNDVIGAIAALAAHDIQGIAGMTGSLVGGLTEILGKRLLARGVKVEVHDGHVGLDLYVVVEFGSRIPEVAQKVQEHVKTVVEAMTGLTVAQVDIHVQGVSFPHSPPPPPVLPRSADPS